MLAEVQFSTHLNDDSDTPIFKKGAAFIFKYQAVTSESESKVRVFSPFPRLPEINLTEAYSLIAHRGHSDTLAGMNTVKRCQTAASEEAYELLFNRIDEQLTVLDKEIAEAEVDRTRLVEIAISFLPQQSMLAGNTGSRSRRAIGLIAAAAGAAGLILGDPVKDAACSALSIFSLCSDNTELEADVENMLKQQTVFQKTLERVQNRNDENFFLLGNEIKETQESVAKITEVVSDNLQKLDVELREIKGVISHLVDCNAHLAQTINYYQQLQEYISYLNSLYTHVKSYRAAFYAYKIALFSTLSSLAAGYVTPQFLLPDQLASIVKELANDEILRGTKLSPAIRVGHEAIYYEIQLVLEVTLLSSGLSVVLGIPMNSKSSTFDIYLATPLYQPNADGDTASLYQFPNPFLAISTDNTQFAELGASTLQQCSGNNRIKLCRKGFSTTTDETLLCLASLFYNYDVPSVRNCKVESILLPDAPQAFYLADGMYHVVSRHPALRMKNDSRSAGFTISTLTCQACIVRPSCSSTLSFNQGDLVLTPDMDFCETHPLPLIASIQLTPSLDQVFKHVPPASSQFHVYSVAEARQSVLNSVRMELAEIPDVKRMSPESLDQLTKPIADYYSSISPATSAALSAYLPTRTAVCFSLLSITVSLLTFCVSFTLFRRQWRRLFSHPQQFFRGTSGRFLHIVDGSSPPNTDDSSFLYLSVAEFKALQELAQETLRRLTLTTNPTNYSTTNPPPHPVVASDTTSVNHNRVYPIVTAPIYQESSS